MAIQLVGRYRTGYLPLSTSGATVSLTSLTGGLASQPASGDIIIIALVTAGTTNHTLTIKDSSGGSDYTLIGVELYANDTRDTNLRVAYKFAGGSPDTSCFVNVSTAINTCHIAVEVWRGVEPSNPLDVAATTATGINTGQPDPAAITPVTAGALILVAGAGTTPYNAPADFTSSSFDGFTSGYQAGDGTRTFSAILGIGYKAWTSGAFDAAVFGGGANNSNESWASITFALRPVSIKGALSKTLADITSTASGVTPVRGVLSLDLGSTFLTSGGEIVVSGSLTKTLADTVLAASGTAPANRLAVTLDDVTLTAAGIAPIYGTGNSTLGAINVSAQATSTITGALAVSLLDTSAASAGQVTIQGALTSTLTDATLAAQALLPVFGTVNTTLADITLTARGGSYIAAVPPALRSLKLRQAKIQQRSVLLSEASLTSRTISLRASHLAHRRLELK